VTCTEAESNESLPTARKGVDMPQHAGLSNLDLSATRRVAKKVAGSRSLRRPPEKSLVMTAPREGCKTIGRHSLRIVIFNPDSHCVDLAPLRGAIRFIIRSGGLRGLRPPATFFATLRVAPRSVNYINTLAKHRLALNFAAARRLISPVTAIPAVAVGWL